MRNDGRGRQSEDRRADHCDDRGDGSLSHAMTMPAPAAVLECTHDLRDICREAWQEGLLAGCNGNASVRLPPPDDSLVCITRTGAAKARLDARDCCLVDAATGRPLANGPASSEAGMHLALYAALPACRAILHTHPRRLLALSLALALRPGADLARDMLRLPLYEAETWRARLAFAPALAPGTRALALAVADAAQSLAPAGATMPLEGGAIWLSGHGLCCFGPSLASALAMSEELEHLAAIQLGAAAAMPIS